MPEINASMEFAQDGFHEYRLSASAPVSDNLGIRFNALTWDFDGFHTNTVTGNKVGGGEGHSASILFDYNPVGNDKWIRKTMFRFLYLTQVKSTW